MFEVNWPKTDSCKCQCLSGAAPVLGSRSILHPRLSSAVHTSVPPETHPALFVTHETNYLAIKQTFLLLQLSKSVFIWCSSLELRNPTENIMLALDRDWAKVSFSITAKELSVDCSAIRRELILSPAHLCIGCCLIHASWKLDTPLVAKTTDGERQQQELLWQCWHEWEALLLLGWSYQTLCNGKKLESAKSIVHFQLRPYLSPKQKITTESWLMNMAKNSLHQCWLIDSGAVSPWERGRLWTQRCQSLILLAVPSCSGCSECCFVQFCSQGRSFQSLLLASAWLISLPDTEL